MRLGRLALANILGLLIIIIIAAIAFYIWHQNYYFYSTDDAAVSATIVNVAPLQAGVVDSVQAAGGQNVDRGSTVATISPAPDGAGTGAAATAPSSGGQTGSSSGSNSGKIGNGSGSGTGGASQGTVTPGGSPAGSPGPVRIHAPIGGTILNVMAQPGQAVQPGQPIALEADLSKVYITAYVDETRINDIKPGQGVDITVDAINDVTFHGHVSRIIPATASTFSLIPTNNYASGNFTKVTQRIPVRITLDGLEGKTLYPNTDASVTIHVHE